MVTLPVTSNSCAYPSNSNRFQMQLCERTLRTWIDDRNERIQKNLATGWSLSFSYDDVKVVDSTTRFGQILRHWKNFLRVYLEFGLIFNLIWILSEYSITIIDTCLLQCLSTRTFQSSGKFCPVSITSTRRESCIGISSRETFSSTAREEFRLKKAKGQFLIKMPFVNIIRNDIYYYFYSIIWIVKMPH